VRASALPKVSEEAAGEAEQDVKCNELPEGDTASASRFRYLVDTENLHASTQQLGKCGEMRCKKKTREHHVHATQNKKGGCVPLTLRSCRNPSKELGQWLQSPRGD